MFVPRLKYAVTVWVLLLVFATAYCQSEIKRPNIIVILADDLGWKDLSCYGSSFYETRVLDSLASAGIRFTNNYASSPVCSPTRASLLTGKYPTKTGITDWIKGRQENGRAKPYEKLIAHPTAYQLALSEETIAKFAVANGYKTFFAGKWHLGEEEKFWPEHHGFQENKGGWSSGSPTGRTNDSTGGFFVPYKNPRLTDGPPGEYLTDRLTSECINFINKNAGTPFLLVYSLYAVHNPMQAPAPLIRKYEAKRRQAGIHLKEQFAKDEDWMKFENNWKRRLVQGNAVYAAMMENMDWNIGRIMQQLKRSAIDDNTVIIFTSDNGGLSTAEGSPTTNEPLRAGKGWLYEGGIRVPLIISWKGKVSPGVADMPVNTIDLYPTIAGIINKKYKQSKSVDGTDIFQMLAKPKLVESRQLIWHYPHYSNQGGRPGAAIRSGKFKLIYYFEDESVELFNITEDQSELRNIARQNPKITASLKGALLKWLRKNSPHNPARNPGYSNSITRDKMTN